MFKKLILITVCSLLGLGGCNLIYKQTIQQGNAIEQDKLDELKIGMTMNQVAFLMGTPAIRDPFHQQRWDYYNSYSIRGVQASERLVTLRFENSILKEIKGADLDNPDGVETGEAVEETDNTAAVEDLQADEAEPVISAIETPDAEVIDIADATDVVAEPVAAGPVAADPVVSEPEQEFISETAQTPVTPEPEKVSHEVAPVPAPAPEPEEDINVNPQWFIQMGAFESKRNADNLVTMMRKEGFQAAVSMQLSVLNESRYIVRTPGFESRSQAQRQLDMINSALDLDGFLVPPER
jgi:outer membrane protein assembly factor BamE